MQQGRQSDARIACRVGVRDWKLHLMPVLRSEIPSGMCAKLRTVAASNSRDHPTRSLYYCLLAPHIYFFSSRTSRSWWITQSTQHHRRGCNTTSRLQFFFCDLLSIEIPLRSFRREHQGQCYVINHDYIANSAEAAEVLSKMHISGKVLTEQLQQMLLIITRNATHALHVSSREPIHASFLEGTFLYSRCNYMCWKDFSRGTIVDVSKGYLERFFRRWRAKVDQFYFIHSKLRKQPFFATTLINWKMSNFKIQWVQSKDPCPPYLRPHAYMLWGFVHFERASSGNSYVIRCSVLV